LHNDFKEIRNRIPKNTSSVNKILPECGFAALSAVLPLLS
jgi:hypothetical protein